MLICLQYVVICIFCKHEALVQHLVEFLQTQTFRFVFLNSTRLVLKERKA